MENKTIEQLLSSLAALVGDARGSLFGQDKCMVDREQLISLVEQLRAQMPAEIEQAKTIIANSNMIRTNAKKDAAETRKEADGVLSDAETRAAKLIEDTTIVEFAKKREQEILDEAQQQRDLLISGALEYADHIIEEAEKTVRETLETMDAGVSALQRRCQEELDVSLSKLAEARTALKKTAKPE